MEKRPEMKLKIGNDELKGVYANQIAIMHSKDDFAIDFITAFPPEAVVNCRIITNPVALKRMLHALTINLTKYEEQFGTIKIDGDNGGPSGEVIN